jgi:nicotinate-nucleotide pyrophosphorylase (carboxylating)
MTVDVKTLDLIRRALAEDVGSGDATTESTIPEGHRSSGRIVAKEEGVLAGLPVAEAVFRMLDPDVTVRREVADGAHLMPGAVVATIEGRTRAILTAERVALNFLQRLSGVATLTARYVRELDGTRTKLLDTRKTTPGMRTLEKYAVVIGGGVNHRMGLWDMALIKDNHIAAAGGITPAVAGVRECHPELAIEVEVTCEDQLREALVAGADRIMLDNMSDDEMRAAIAIARGHEVAPEIEISGGVSLSDLRRVAELEPDYVSVGALTHSAPALDLSLDLEGSK